MKSTIVWFRQDLRLEDNPALLKAIDRGTAILPVYIWSPEEDEDWPMGGASKVWLHHSLYSLDKHLQKFKSRLLIVKGPCLDTLQSLIKTHNAECVYWNRCYEPASIKRDAKIKEALGQEGIEAKSFNGSLLYEPWEIQTRQGNCFKVFTPYWKAMQALPGEPPHPLPTPDTIPSPKSWPKSLHVDELNLLPTIDWDTGIREAWTPGIDGASEQLERFLDEAVPDYAEKRDFPAQHATSRISPHLHFGEISPRQIWHRVTERVHKQSSNAYGDGAWGYLREIAWREFGYHLMYYFPHTPTKPLRDDFNAFPWNNDSEALKAWQQGKTGYPLVDAGMRELWHTGWMHNRVRMVVASFLVKHLRIHWLEGARWFWDTLVDADLASNTMGWQWSAGSGADAAPYFRIFNPITQSERFDPAGEYIRRWVPELSELPDSMIHTPWKAKDSLLDESGITIGNEYPEPIVDHSTARNEALAAFDSIKKK